jgi:hypothetical protein
MTTILLLGWLLVLVISYHGGVAVLKKTGLL